MIGEVAGAGDVEGRWVVGGDVLGQVGFGAGLAGLERKGDVAGGGEGDGVRDQDGEGFNRRGEPGGEGELAGVGQGVADAELGLAGADGEEEGEVAGVGAGNGGGLDGHAALRNGAGAADEGTLGKVEFEAVGAKLGAGRGGGVEDLENFDDVKLVGRGFYVELFDAGADAVDVGGGIVDGHGYSGGAGLDRLEVVGLLVGDADEVHAVVGDLEGKAAAGVGGGAGGLLHGLLKLDEDDVVADGGLAGGFIDDGAGNRGRGVGQQGREEQGERGGEVAELAKVGHVFQDTSAGVGYAPHCGAVRAVL